MKKNKIIIYFISICMLIVAIILFFSKENSDVSLEELQVYSKKNENIVMTNFANKYNINSVGKNFWKKTYEGKKPIDSLYEFTLNDITEHRSILKFAEDLKIIEPISFSEEKKVWQGEDSSLDFVHFLDEKDQDLKNKIMEDLLKKEPPNEEQLRVAFDELDDKYKVSDYMIEGLEFPTFQGDIGELENLAKRIPPNTGSEDIVKYWTNNLPNTLVEPFKIKSDEVQKEDIYTLSIADVLIKEDVGNVVKGYNDNQYFYIINKEGGELLKYEDAPQFAENYYINELYEKKLKSYKKSVNVEVSSRNKKKFIEAYQK